jgi:hypothetical protein
VDLTGTDFQIDPFEDRALLDERLQIFDLQHVVSTPVRAQAFNRPHLPN